VTQELAHLPGADQFYVCQRIHLISSLHLLNTVQFHVKNIYGKLAVNRRVEAIEKAREMNLI